METSQGAYSLKLEYSLQLIWMTEEQFQDEMAARRATLANKNEYDVGCPLCWSPVPEYETAGGSED